MGKTRDLFKKIRDIKGTFHAKMGLIKDRNGMDLTEVEGIKKRRQEYTEELYKKYMKFRKMVTITLYARQQKRHRYKQQSFGLWEKAKVG